MTYEANLHNGLLELTPCESFGFLTVASGQDTSAFESATDSILLISLIYPSDKEISVNVSPSDWTVNYTLTNAELPLHGLGSRYFSHKLLACDAEGWNAFPLNLPITIPSGGWVKGVMYLVQNGGYPLNLFHSFFQGPLTGANPYATVSYSAGDMAMPTEHRRVQPMVVFREGDTSSSWFHSPWTPGNGVVESRSHMVPGHSGYFMRFSAVEDPNLLPSGPTSAWSLPIRFSAPEGIMRSVLMGSYGLSVK
jgi:hypothetical protein